MRIDPSTPTVVIPCGVGHSSTCIARSLGRLSIPVYCVESVGGAFASFSRYCKGSFAWDDKLPPVRSVQFLLDVGKKIGRRSILIAATDATVAFIAENAQALQDWFIFPQLCPELVHSLCSKKEMLELATKLGVATPKAAFPNSRQDVLDFLENAMFPVMMKGIDGNRLAKRTGQKMFLVQNESELLHRYDAAEDPEQPNLMLQEYIPGGDDAVCFFNGYFNKFSDCAFAITGRKLRQWPAYQGTTTLGVCLRNETVARITSEFMKAIGYQGIVDIGYRYDARDGLYKVLDVNPRIGCTFRLFVAENGLDVARALYLDLTGQPIPVAPVREGRKWMVEDTDLLSSARYLLDRRLTLREWMGSFRGIKESAYFAADDPLPLLAMCAQRSRGALGWSYRRLTGGGAWPARSAAYSPNRWA